MIKVTITQEVKEDKQVATCKTLRVLGIKLYTKTFYYPLELLQEKQDATSKSEKTRKNN